MAAKKPKISAKKKPASKGGQREGQGENQPKQEQAKPAPEVGGRGGLDPTRYGDWEIGGRCVDF